MHVFVPKQNQAGQTPANITRSDATVARSRTHPLRGRSPASRERSKPALGPALGSLIERSRPAGGLSAATLAAINGIPRFTLEKIRIHDDSPAHKAAEQLEARAFTVGSAIYFARGEYQPTSNAGRHVLAHEAAHVHQQARATLPPTIQLRVASPSSREEAEARRFANAQGSGAAAATPAQLPAGNVARLMRVTFETNPPPPVKRDIKESFEEKNADSFGFGWCNPTILSWASGDVKVHGTPEPGSEWRVGPMQVLKDYWFNISWGEGDNQKECGQSFPALNLRDTRNDISKDNSPWYDSGKVSEPFLADGDTRSTYMEDSPGFFSLPYNHPELADGFGKFNFGCTFFAYLSAVNANGGGAADSVQHLKRLYWQTMLAGRFDARKPMGERLRITDGGMTEAGSIDDVKPTDPGPPLAGEANSFLNPMTACWTGKRTAPKRKPEP